MAKVEKTAQSAIHAICHAKDPSNDTHHASQSPRSQPPLSKTRHNKVIRESDNTVQRVSACFVVLMYVVLTQMASQTPLLHVESVQKPLTQFEEDDEHAHETSWQPSYWHSASDVQS